MPWPGLVRRTGLLWCARLGVAGLRRALHARLWETGLGRLGVAGLGHLGVRLGVHLRVAVRADRAGAEWFELPLLLPGRQCNGEYDAASDEDDGDDADGDP